MIKSQFWLSTVLALIVSTNAMAHGDHSTWTGNWGLLGAALNVMEFGKHAVVIGDQLTAEEEERNKWVLGANAAVALGHVYMAAQHFLHAKAVEHHHHGHKHELPLLAAANLFGVVDAVVDGVTTWEYWAHEPSWQKTAVMLVTPACLVSNLALMAVKVAKAIKPKQI